MKKTNKRKRTQNLTLASEQKQEKIKPTVCERRLDELAWLLENTSKCAAVSIINDRLYVATNDFFTGTEQKNNLLGTVLRIMNYFKDLATDKVKFNSVVHEKKRSNLMQIILKNQIKTARLGRDQIDDKIIHQIVYSDIILQKKFPLRILEDKFVKKNLGQAYQALGQGIELYKRFSKIEQSIQKAKKNDFREITKGQLTAFKDFSHSSKDRGRSNILFLDKDDDKNVHAEAQILNQIVNMIDAGVSLPAEIYIGISKRCCKDCHCLLDATNEVLKTQGPLGILIKFEGSHDAEFTANWGRPPVLIEGELSTFSKTRQQTRNMEKQGVISLKAKINNKYKEKVQGFSETPESYEQRHSNSSSEVGDHLLDMHKQRLQEDLEVLLKYKVEQPIVTLLKLGIQLCELDEVKNVCETGAVVDDTQALLVRIVREYEVKHNRKIELEMVNDFLSDPKLAGPIYKCVAKAVPNTSLGVKVGIASSHDEDLDDLQAEGEDSDGIEQTDLKAGVFFGQGMQAAQCDISSAGATSRDRRKKRKDDIEFKQCDSPNKKFTL